MRALLLQKQGHDTHPSQVPFFCFLRSSVLGSVTETWFSPITIALLRCPNSTEKWQRWQSARGATICSALRTSKEKALYLLTAFVFFYILAGSVTGNATSKN